MDETHLHSHLPLKKEVGIKIKINFMKKCFQKEKKTEVDDRPLHSHFPLKNCYTVGKYTQGLQHYNSIPVSIRPPNIRRFTALRIIVNCAIV